MIKKILILFFMVIVLLNGCTTTNNFELSKENFEQEIKWNYWSSFDVLIDQGKNYKVFTDKQNTGYYYIVTDNNGDILDKGYHSWRGDIHFEEKEELLILWYGFGFSSWQCRYYDIVKEKVSRFFWKPVQSSDKLVVYFKTDEDAKITLIVQDIFDLNKYYKEFKTLPKLFSVSEAEIREDKIYYIEHAERTFTLFSYDIETEEKKIIIGSGESEPDEILIKNFVFVENDLYIFQRMPQVLYQYNNGNMKIISDFCIKWMSSWNGGLLYSFDNTSTFLYFYDNDNIKIIEMVPFDTLRGLTIVDGCIYFFDGNPQVIQYNEIKS